MTGDLHPEAQALLDLAGSQLWPPTHALSVESARQRLEELTSLQSTEAVGTVEEYAIPGPESDVPVRLYEPESDGPHPILVYLHGGGLTVGGLDTHDNVCAALTNRVECLTVSVDYRLAPEHPFPAGLEDAYAAIEWVAEYGAEINGDPERLAASLAA